MTRNILDKLGKEVETELGGMDDAIEMPEQGPAQDAPEESLTEDDDSVEIGFPMPEPDSTSNEDEEAIINYEDNVIDMTSVDEGKEHELMSIAVSSEFNPATTQNGLEDEEVEGGVYRYRSSSAGFASSNQGGTYKGRSAKIDEGKVELSGFKIVVDFGNGDQSIDVKAMFNDLNTAKASINGDKFVFIDKGAMRVGTIVSGSPVISNDEREIAKHINGDWKRS